jgi:hypothetical protein
MIALGLRLARPRVLAPAPLVAFGVALVTILLVAALERHTGSDLALDRTLFGVAFGLAVPGFCYVLAGAYTSRNRLGDADEAVARRGASRRALLLGGLSFTALLAAVACAALGAVAVFAAAPSWEATSKELPAVALAGLLAGPAYVALFTLGSSLGRHGGGRAWFLTLDWLFGRGTLALALPWPRAHIRTLLGAEPVLELSVTPAIAALIVLTLGYLMIALRRVPA